MSKMTLPLAGMCSLASSRANICRVLQIQGEIKRTRQEPSWRGQMEVPILTNRPGLLHSLLPYPHITPDPRRSSGFPSLLKSDTNNHITFNSACLPACLPQPSHSDGLCVIKVDIARERKREIERKARDMVWEIKLVGVVWKNESR